MGRVTKIAVPWNEEIADDACDFHFEKKNIWTYKSDAAGCRKKARAPMRIGTHAKLYDDKGSYATALVTSLWIENNALMANVRGEPHANV